MSLIAELKRRNVFRVGVAYAIVGWLLLEVASVVLPTFEAPNWVMKVFTFLLILGFPVALIFAWAFELTPEGIKRESAVAPDESTAHRTGRKLDFAIIGLLALAVVFMFVDNYVLETEPKQTEVPVEEIPAVEPVGREKSIAVLPFDNISPNPEDAYFADGIHDEVLAQLSKIRDLKVISRTSVMRYRREDRPSLPEIANALGAANILEGSVRLAGNQVRITTQLIEAESDTHLWTETYDRELTAANIFSIQSEIAKTVADALRATLSPEEQDRLATVPTENLAAYQAYLLGKQRIADPTTAAFAEAVDYLEQAIELDPDFALAYTQLARTYILIVNWLGLPKNEMHEKAEVLIERALGLDDQLGESYAVLGLLQDERHQYEDALASFRGALELYPGSAWMYSWYAGTLHALGRLEEALKLRRNAVELDPLSAFMITMVGNDLNALGRFDEGLSWYKKSFQINPDYPYNLYNIAFHYRLVSREYGEAIRWYGKAIASDPGDPYSPAALGGLYMELGDSDNASYWIQRSIETHPGSLASNNLMQLLYLYQRDETAGLEYGRKAFAIDGGSSWSLAPVILLGDREVRAGRYSEARDLYAQGFPELLSEDDSKVTYRNYQAAINLALVLSNTDEQERADLLLDRSFQQIQAVPRLGFYGYGITDVQIHALKGDKQRALAALRQAIDEGWRTYWWYFLKQDPTLESLHDEPEFQAMIAEIDADMAAQLARVREMERNGELEPIPEISATTY
jgi:TolB-like protein/Tfp pilus assembly protein PilF